MLISELPLLFQHLRKTLPEYQSEMRRLFHGRGQKWPGLEQITVDWVAENLIVTLFKPVDDAFLDTLKQQLVDFSYEEVWSQASGKGIGLQHRYEYGAPFDIITGDIAEEVIGVEDDLKYQLVLGKNQNMGIFLDMRHGRQWIKKRAKNKNILNLFSYTCGFSVAAIAGGAKSVVNVDMARGALSRGRDNHRLNDHDLSTVTFMGHDIFRSWGKITKFGPYDLIVIDPPSFQKGSFALTKDYKKILRRLPSLLCEGGEVLACVNSPAVSPDFLTISMNEEAPELIFIERLDNPEEFADIDEQASLKALVFELR